VNVSDEHTKSLWMRTDVAPDAPTLKGEQRCDTAIVGSGIAGLSAAHELSKAGHSVIVVDRGPIAGGMTSRTTAHLTSLCDDGNSSLVKLRGEEIARIFHESQAAAIDSIEANVKAYGIECEFRRLDGYLFPAMGMDAAEARKTVDEDYKTARQLGMEVEKAKGVPLSGFEDSPTLIYRQQATFHPLKYLRGLVGEIGRRGGQLFANSAVTEIEEIDGEVRITAEGGARIIAKQAIIATNGPIYDRFELHTKMAPYRTYAMAFTLPRGSLPDALYWDMADPYHYVRLSSGPGTVDYLIVGGADHKTGEADDGQVRFEAVEAWIRQLVPDLGKEVHRWSGQVMDTIDYCGFIGRNPGNDKVFVATGDSGQGITHGALAGLLLRDLIISGASPWEQTYEPGRKPLKSAFNYVKENVTALKSFAEYVAPGEITTLDQLKPGEGAIYRSGLSKLAVYRDPAGALSAHSAVCTHVGCHIHWNSTERCWDCPCHGSHFAPDGSVLNGPAINPLAKAEVPSS
jgi:glycine/D-amino acid oxidase-like deaminating enzyme/nitrite reductase/ring-hydroxylating ferredoxin subunit